MTEHVPVHYIDDIPGEYKSLGIHKTLGELHAHYEKWKKAKPNQHFILGWMKHGNEIWYSVWTKTPKNAKKMGVGMKPKTVGKFGDLTNHKPELNCPKLEKEGNTACHFCRSFKSCKIVRGDAIFKPLNAPKPRTAWKKEQAFPMKKKIDGDWYFFEDFTFSKEDASAVVARLIKTYPNSTGKIKAKAIQHGNDKLWGVYFRVEK